MTTGEQLQYKRCCTCKQSKPVAEFGRRRPAKDGLQRQCRKCVSDSERRRRESGVTPSRRRQWWAEKSKDDDWLAERNLRRSARRYKLGVEVARKMLTQARCAICNTASPGGRYGNWHIDHDHHTGAVRGVLCCRCNLMIGLAHERATTLRKAADYLGEGRA